MQKPWRAWYGTQAWKAIRREHLTAHPLCAWCERKGRLVRATVVHHVERHNGDEVKFFAGPFESLCAPCHDSDAQSAERTGYSKEIGVDGWPVDVRHPQHKRW